VPPHGVALLRVRPTRFAAHRLGRRARRGGVQDVGVFATAHNTGATGEVDFDGFTVGAP
jgi:hypothetical protein